MEKRVEDDGHGIFRDEIMRDKMVFMFSGQGSQYFHMGKAFYDHEPEFREQMNRLDAVFQELSGNSLIRYLYDERRSKSDEFVDLFYTHPAIFMVEVATAHMLMSKGIRPQAVIGSSMGEYAAAVVAGALDAEDGLRCLFDQARLLKALSPPGGMIAVLTSPALYDEVPVIHHHAQLAAVNHQSHFVLAGNEEGLDVVERYLRMKDITHLRLPVTVPFHSAHIDAAGEAVRERLWQVTFRPPRIPFYSSVTGRRMPHLTANYFWDVLRQPIRFGEALNEAVAHGVTFIDLGPSGTLANLANAHFRTKRDLHVFSLLSPFTGHQKALEMLYARLLQP